MSGTQGVLIQFSYSIAVVGSLSSISCDTTRGDEIIILYLIKLIRLVVIKD